MRVVSITGKRQVAIKYVPVSQAHERFVLVKIHSVPMCTEFKDYQNGIIQKTLGHECAGEVVAVGSTDKIRIGDRVVPMMFLPCGQCELCNAGDYVYCENKLNYASETGYEYGAGTYAEFMLTQDWQLLNIPDGMSYDHAAMAGCALGPTFGAIKKMNLGNGDTILIVGLGPVGLGGIINARYRGTRIIAVERFGYRCQLATALGAEVIVPIDHDTLPQILEFTKGRGVDAAIDCTGTADAQRLAIDAVRVKGQVALVGWGGSITLDIPKDMLRKGLTIHGIWHWNSHYWNEMLTIISKTASLLDILVTHRFPLEKVREAFDLQLSGQCGKIILYPWHKNRYG